MFETLKRLLIGTPAKKRPRHNNEPYRPRPEDPWEGSSAP